MENSKLDIDNSSRIATSFISVVAIIGVVYYHLVHSQFYIGKYPGWLDLQKVIIFWKENGFFFTLVEIHSGFSAVIGLFLIISGYGLTKKHQATHPYSFLLNRFKKIYLYSLLMAMMCTLLTFIFYQKWTFSYWSAFTLVYGFYDQLSRGPGVGQYWYLAIQFACYLVFLPIRNMNSMSNLLVLSLLIAFGFGVCIRLGLVNIVSFYHSSICRFPEFVAGMFLARSKICEVIVFRFSYLRLAFSIIWVALGCISFFNIWTSLYAHFVFSTGLFFFLAQCINFLSRWPLVTIITNYLSGGTFTLYLLHLVTVFHIFGFFNKRVFSPVKEISHVYAGVVQFLSLVFIVICCVGILVIGRRIESWYQLKLNRLWP
ncbi:MAG: acyltransferase family protein [Candidatus Scalinduaceae bacterium]